MRHLREVQLPKVEYTILKLLEIFALDDREVLMHITQKNIRCLCEVTHILFYTQMPVYDSRR